MSLGPSVVSLDEQDFRPVDAARWARLATAVLVAEGIGKGAELNITFIDSAEMAVLNEEHMDGDGPTDVLSFPLDDEDSTVFDGQDRLLGDVLICPEVVDRQAPDRYDDEMALMVVHGVLHILGHDHFEPEETAVMKAAEARHLDVWRASSSEQP